MTGIETRSTTGIGATIKGWPLDEAHIRTAINSICAVPVNDRIDFQPAGISYIREDDEYGGFRVSLNTVHETVKALLSIDITTGDAITPKPVKRVFKSLFDEASQFELWTYNTESILAKKIETILRRSVSNTRPRDFYDVYIITKTQDFDAGIFRQALNETAIHRGTAEDIQLVLSILTAISKSKQLKAHWKVYQNRFPYAKKVTFEEIIQSIKDILIV